MKCVSMVVAELRAAFRARAGQETACEMLNNLSVICTIASIYLFFFSNADPYAPRLAWAAVLAVDAVVAFVFSVLLTGDEQCSQSS